MVIAWAGVDGGGQWAGIKTRQEQTRTDRDGFSDKTGRGLALTFLPSCLPQQQEKVMSLHLKRSLSHVFMPGSGRQWGLLCVSPCTPTP